MKLCCSRQSSARRGAWGGYDDDALPLLTTRLSQRVQHQAQLAAKARAGHEEFAQGRSGRLTAICGPSHVERSALLQGFDQRIPGEVGQGHVGRDLLRGDTFFTLLQRAFLKAGDGIPQRRPVLNHDQGVGGRVIQQAGGALVKPWQILLQTGEEGSVLQRAEVAARAGGIVRGQGVEPGA